MQSHDFWNIVTITVQVGLLSIRTEKILMKPPFPPASSTTSKISHTTYLTLSKIYGYWYSQFFGIGFISEDRLHIGLCDEVTKWNSFDIKQKRSVKRNMRESNWLCATKCEIKTCIWDWDTECDDSVSTEIKVKQIVIWIVVSTESYSNSLYQG